jgi:hypothetical protein
MDASCSGKSIYDCCTSGEYIQRGFELKNWFKALLTLSTYLFSLHMLVVLKKQEKEKVNVNEPPLNIT